MYDCCLDKKESKQINAKRKEENLHFEHSPTLSTPNGKKECVCIQETEKSVLLSICGIKIGKCKIMTLLSATENGSPISGEEEAADPHRIR